MVFAMIWNDPNHKTPQEVADEQDEHNAEEYEAMYAEVEAEFRGYFFEWEIAGGQGVDGARVHAETMKRLRAKSATRNTCAASASELS